MSEEPELVIAQTSPELRSFWRSGKHWSTNEERPATNDELSSAEQRLGVKLPSLLTDLYLIKNGGYTAYAFAALVPNPKPTYDDWANLMVDGISPLQALETVGDVSDSCDFGADGSWRTANKDVDRLIVFSRHGMDWLLCLDYRETGPESEPRVVSYEGFEIELKEQLRFADFERFFNSLRMRKR